jgi:DNA-binding transcriptional ArsR family regulator
MIFTAAQRRAAEWAVGQLLTHGVTQTMNGDEPSLPAQIVGAVESALDAMPVDESWARVASHPLRVRILREVESRGTASPHEIAVALDASLGTVSYHVRFLAREKMLKLERTTPRRGAVEHHYRLVTA